MIEPLRTMRRHKKRTCFTVLVVVVDVVDVFRNYAGGMTVLGRPEFGEP